MVSGGGWRTSEVPPSSRALWPTGGEGRHHLGVEEPGIRTVAWAEAVSTARGARAPGGPLGSLSFSKCLRKWKCPTRL